MRNKTQDSYQQMTVYFDLTNPYQKECYELLMMIQKKKALFMGLLAHNFLMQFEAKLSPDDLVNYIKSYDLICKMKPQGQHSVPLDVTHPQEEPKPAQNKKKRADETNEAGSLHESADTRTQEQPINVSDVMAAMNVFST